MVGKVDAAIPPANDSTVVEGVEEGENSEMREVEVGYDLAGWRRAACLEVEDNEFRLYRIGVV